MLFRFCTALRGRQSFDQSGLGTELPGEVEKDDDAFETYRKRMMLAYRFRPNPLVRRYIVESCAKPTVYPCRTIPGDHITDYKCVLVCLAHTFVSRFFFFFLTLQIAILISCDKPAELALPGNNYVGVVCMRWDKHGSLGMYV